MTNPDELEVAAAESDVIWSKSVNLTRELRDLERQRKRVDARYDREAYARYKIMKGLSNAARWFPWGDSWSLDGV